MVVTFRFTLPEETSEYETFAKAERYAGVVADFSTYLRHALKYATERPTLDAVYDEWWRMLAEAKIDPWT